MKIEVMRLIAVTCIVAAALVGCGSDSDDETPPDTVEVESEVDEEKQEVEEEKQEVKNEVDEEVNG